MAPAQRHATAVLAAIPTLRVHVLAAAAGIALFALASAFAAMYLLQQRELKGKRFGPLMFRLPALDVLDRASGWLLVIGFGIFTIAVVTGVVVARSALCAPWGWDAQLVASVLVWAVFGVLVLGRHAGQHGARQASLTIVAFVFSSLVGLRHTGATRHASLDDVPGIACISSGR